MTPYRRDIRTRALISCQCLDLTSSSGETDENDQLTQNSADDLDAIILNTAEQRLKRAQFNSFMLYYKEHNEDVILNIYNATVRQGNDPVGIEAIRKNANRAQKRVLEVISKLSSSENVRVRSYWAKKKNNYAQK